MKHVIRIGISGWSYAPWRKTFYPAKLAHRRELEFASRQVTAIEINGAFYSLPKVTSFEAWAAEVPDDFVFTIKGHRFITHLKKLHEVAEPVANFFASGVLTLGTKLGPVLWQFPPQMKFTPERFATFLDLLPTDFNQAAKLARRHGPMMNGRAHLPKQRPRPPKIRHAVEVRHSSFDDPEFFKLLKKHNVALVTADTAGRWPYFEEPTADFTYVRLHGDVKLYESGYPRSALKTWATKIKRWARRGDVFVFFDNDVKVQAPYNAVELLTLIDRNYQPDADLDDELIKDLKTAGPRLSPIDSRWRPKK